MQGKFARKKRQFIRGTKVRGLDTRLLDLSGSEKYRALDNTRKRDIDCYVCQNAECGHITKTVTLVKGATPFQYTCEKCDSQAISTFGKDVAPDREPTIEWYRPSWAELTKWNAIFGMREHVLSGGLIDRVIGETRTPQDIIDDILAKRKSKD